MVALQNFIGFVVTALNHNDYIKNVINERFTVKLMIIGEIEEYAGISLLSRDLHIKESIENEFQRLV